MGASCYGTVLCLVSSLEYWLFDTVGIKASMKRKPFILRSSSSLTSMVGLSWCPKDCRAANQPMLWSVSQSSSTNFRTPLLPACCPQTTFLSKDRKLILTNAYKNKHVLRCAWFHPTELWITMLPGIATDVLSPKPIGVTSTTVRPFQTQACRNKCQTCLQAQSLLSPV